jgi:hypothetical protein
MYKQTVQQQQQQQPEHIRVTIMDAGGVAAPQLGCQLATAAAQECKRIN